MAILHKRTTTTATPQPKKEEEKKAVEEITPKDKADKSPRASNGKKTTKPAKKQDSDDE